MHFVDQQLLGYRRPGRGGAGHRREGQARLRGGGEAAMPLRGVFPSAPEGRAQGPPSQAPDHADPVGAAAGEVTFRRDTESAERSRRWMLAWDTDSGSM